MIPEGKLYYTIGEVAEMLDCNTSQVRYWSGEFSLKLRKNRKGDRLFQSKNLDKLRLIKKLLKEEGYTIEGAKKKISNGSSKNDSENIETSVEKVIVTEKQVEVNPLDTNEIVSKLKGIKSNLERLKIEIERNL